jgi:hypothetical protein
MSHPGEKLVLAGEQCGPSRRTTRADREIRETRALTMQGVKVGRLDDWITMGGNIALTHIIY